MQFTLTLQLKGLIMVTGGKVKRNRWKYFSDSVQPCVTAPGNIDVIAMAIAFFGEWERKPRPQAKTSS